MLNETQRKNMDEESKGVLATLGRLAEEWRKENPERARQMREQREREEREIPAGAR